MPPEQKPGKTNQTLLLALRLVKGLAHETSPKDCSVIKKKSRKKLTVRWSHGYKEKGTMFTGKHFESFHLENGGVMDGFPSESFVVDMT